MHQAQRTQIYLPTELRREVDRQRVLSGESLSEYLRKALKERLERQKKSKAELKKLAEEFVGSSKRSDKEIQEWLNWVREERRLSDKVREARLKHSLAKK